MNGGKGPRKEEQPISHDRISTHQAGELSKLQNYYKGPGLLQIDKRGERDMAYTNSVHEARRRHGDEAVPITLGPADWPRRREEERPRCT